VDCDGEEIVLRCLDGGGVWFLKVKVGFGVEFHKDVGRSTLWSLTFWEVHLTDHGLWIVSNDIVIVDEGECSCWYCSAQNDVCA
jgi:hypothetical protein